MLDSLVEWLKELTIFMVICETILSFAPTSTYKRYIKPFVGLIMLLWITSFFFGAVEIDWNQRVHTIFDEYEQSVSRYLENVPIVEVEENRYVEEKENKKLNANIINVEDVVVNPIKIGGIE